ncbi:hypothetical protein HIM_00865 [Hirsutella minnesotensis 3608]|nr:hypothetical protein HIM_00865 [Hirsutella minnesotensis 3608]
MMPRHHNSGFANGYPRGNTFDISPHRFQPRASTAVNRRQRKLLVRIGAAAIAFLLFCIWLWPRGSASFSLLSSPAELELETVRYYDLTNVQGTARGWEREERILLCVPLRDAEAHLAMFFSHLRNFTYPHRLIDLAFLVSDSKDKTLEVLSQNLERIQGDPDPKQPYGEISIIEKDFGQKVNQDVESRHGFAAQASRRKLMAQARNWLLSAALRPYHSWVYWRDVDVETAPFTILEDLMRHNKDVIVPNVWRPLPDWLGGEQPYDLNSWQESETALALADTLDEDAVIVEGYAEYATWRPHLAYLRDPYGDPDMEMEIDGVGGVSILAKAKVFRAGVHFPAFSFQKHAETEGFGKMARRMQYSVVGLPHYVIWHLYEPSVDDIRHMEEMEQERIAREKEEKDKKAKEKKIKEEFQDTNSQWEKDKQGMKEHQEQKVKAKEHQPKQLVQPKSPTKPKNLNGQSQRKEKEGDTASPKKDTQVKGPKDQAKLKGETNVNRKVDGKEQTKDQEEQGSKAAQEMNAKPGKQAPENQAKHASKDQVKQVSREQTKAKDQPEQRVQLQQKQ